MARDLLGNKLRVHHPVKHMDRGREEGAFYDLLVLQPSKASEQDQKSLVAKKNVFKTLVPLLLVVWRKYITYIFNFEINLYCRQTLHSDWFFVFTLPS